jgi:hypothetical protein
MYCVSGLWFGWKAVLRQALAVAEECKRKPLRLSKCDCYRTSLCGSILLLRKFLYSFLIPGNQIPLNCIFEPSHATKCSTPGLCSHRGSVEKSAFLKMLYEFRYLCSIVVWVSAA